MAIGEAIEPEIKANADKRMKSCIENPKENFPEGSQTRDLVAKAAGFGNGNTFEPTKKVVQQAGH